MKSMLFVAGLFLAGLAWGAHTRAWTFDTDSELGKYSVQALKDAGWTVNAAADSDEAFRVDRSTVKGNSGGVLLLSDIASNGTPVASFVFGKSASGRIAMEIGTLGHQNQYGSIRLANGTNVLAEIQLLNNTTGVFRAGAETGVADSKPWYMSTRAVIVEWSGASEKMSGHVNFRFKPAGQGLAPVSVDEMPLREPGIPDRLVLSVGYPTATNRTMVIDNLKIETPN